MRARFAPIAPAFVVAILSLLGTGCEAFDAALLDGGVEEVEDGGGGGDADGGRPPACPLRTPPPRPEGTDDGTGEPRIFALRDMVLDQRGDVWRDIGYDLDDLCSIDPDPEVECRPPSISSPPETDGEGGIDNALGHQITPIVLVVEPGIEEDLVSSVIEGIGVPVVELRGWNGMPDDPRVEVIFTQSAFGTPVVPDEPVETIDFSGEGLLLNGEPWPQPLWDGTDHWWSRSESFVDGDPSRPRVLDDNAYVANSTMVMRLPDRYPLVFGTSIRSFVFSLTDVVFTMRLSADGQSVERGTLAGRFPVLDILDTLERAQVCPGTEEYGQIERLLELTADVRAIAGTGGPTSVCDAVSVGLRWERGVLATRAGVFSVAEPTGCSGPADGGVPDGGALDGGGSDGGGSDGGALDGGVPDGG